MRDALTIVNERMAAIRTERASPDAQISKQQFRSLFLEFEPLMFKFLEEVIEQMGRKAMNNLKVYCPLPALVTANTDDGGEEMVMIMALPYD